MGPGFPFPANVYTLPDNPIGLELNAVKLPVPPGTGVTPAMAIGLAVPGEEDNARTGIPLAKVPPKATFAPEIDGRTTNVLNVPTPG